MHETDDHETEPRCIIQQFAQTTVDLNNAPMVFNGRSKKRRGKERVRAVDLNNIPTIFHGRYKY